MPGIPALWKLRQDNCDEQQFMEPGLAWATASDPVLNKGGDVLPALVLPQLPR